MENEAEQVGVTDAGAPEGTHKRHGDRKAKKKQKKSAR